MHYTFIFPGVLDAAELSMISGSFSKSSGQILSAIEEESVSNFSDLQALEDNLFKELPPSTSKKTKENSGSLLPKKKNNEAPTSVVRFNLEVLIFTFNVIIGQV